MPATQLVRRWLVILGAGLLLVGYFDYQVIGVERERGQEPSREHATYCLTTLLGGLLYPVYGVLLPRLRPRWIAGLIALLCAQAVYWGYLGVVHRTWERLQPFYFVSLVILVGIMIGNAAMLIWRSLQGPPIRLGWDRCERP